MKIKFYTFFATVIFAISFSACSSASRTNYIAAKDNLNDKTNSKKYEIVFNDPGSEFTQKPTSTFGAVPKDNVYTAKDGSAVKISYDGYGNRIETRNFFNHPNLKLLIVTIKTNGDKEGLVFGHNNEHRNLTNAMIDQALTASGNEIANAVGIRTTKIEYSVKPTIVQNTQPVQVNPTIPNPNVQETTDIPPQTQPQELTTETKLPTAEPQIDKKVLQNLPIAKKTTNNNQDN